MGNQPTSQPPSLDQDPYRLSRIPLSHLPAGKSGVVSHLEGGKEFVNRVACLGFTIDAQVTVLHNQGHGPLIVSLLGAHIALGRHEAEFIQVQPV